MKGNLSAKINLGLFAMVLLLHLSCQNQEGFRLLENTGIDFNNRLTPNDSLNVLDYEYFYNGSGVAVGDFNNDGLEDIFFGGNQVSCKLYINEGELQFSDQTAAFGLETDRWITGVNAVDINADGWLDLYLCATAYNDSSRRENLLYINTGKGTFEEQGAAYGLNLPAFSTQSYFLDYDRDGDLDMFLLNHSRNDHDHSLIVNPNNTGTAISTDKLYRNDKGRYTDVSDQAGVRYEGYGLSASILDINRDGWLDIYVANDYIFNDILYINNGDGSFTNAITEYMDHTSQFSMGMDHGDVNRDGYPDIMVADMLPPGNFRQKLMSGPMNYNFYELSLEFGYYPQFMRNTLQMGLPNGKFSEQAFIAGVAMTDWSWSVLMEDYDLDGWEDIFVSNGYVKNITDHDFGSYSSSQRGGRNTKGRKRDNLVNAISELDGTYVPNYLFRNNGGVGFTDVKERWGMDQPSFSNGAATADFDLDGDLDLVVNNIDETAFFYENLQGGGENQSIQLELVAENGTVPEGALVKVTSCLDGVTVKYRVSNKGYLSTSSKYMIVGIGRCQQAGIEVYWPSGKSSLLKDVKPGQRVTLQEATSREKKVFDIAGESQPWIALDSTLTLDQPENRFVDFNFQSMLPIKFSQNGPALASVDLDGNGWDDLVVGAPMGADTKIGLRYDDERMDWITLEGSAYFEDQGILVFDADGDSNLDIYVASGGYETFPNSIQSRDRLYLNDGQNQFRIAPDALPAINQSSSVVRGTDYDADGDIDLFVGGDVYPKKYPLAAPSYLLENSGGQFKDVTQDKIPGLKDIGIIKTALWSDFNDDGRMDLIVAGLFTGIVFFENTPQGFGKVATPYAGALKGWWLSLAGTDIDLDGDIDYVAGNWGENVIYPPSADYPLVTYANDFDQNNTLDFIPAFAQEGKYYPLPPRNMLLDQLNFLKKEFPNYRSYAKADMEAFPFEKMSSSLVYEVETYQSVLLRNLGNSKFSIETLPYPVQVGPVTGITPLDLDHDGFDEILLTGGWEATEVVYGPQDAFKGAILKNSGGDLHWDDKSFIYSGGSTKAQNLCWSGDSLHLVISKAGGKIQTFTIEDTYTFVEVGALTKEIHYEIHGLKKRVEVYLGQGHYAQSSYKLPLSQSAGQVKTISFQ